MFADYFTECVFKNVHPQHACFESCMSLVCRWRVTSFVPCQTF